MIFGNYFQILNIKILLMDREIIISRTKKGKSFIMNMPLIVKQKTLLLVPDGCLDTAFWPFFATFQDRTTEKSNQAIFYS